MKNGPRQDHVSLAVVAGLLLLAMAGCGGGGGGGGNSGVTITSAGNGDFALTVKPSSLSLDRGSSALISVSVSALNGFNSTVSVQAAGIPAGITVSPSTVSVQASVPQTVTLTASASASAGGSPITITGSAGSVTHTASLTLSLNAPSRTSYARTDAVTAYFSWSNPHWAIFNANTNRFFATDPDGNHVYAFDAATKARIATLGVPGAFSLDQTPDGTTLYIGTQIGDVYTIDPAALKVTRRYLASQIGPYGFQAYSALVLADGRLALLGGQGLIQSVDGYTTVAVWNPVDNSIAIYASQYSSLVLGVGIPYTMVCGPLENIYTMSLTADRKKIVIGSFASDSTLCAIDPSTGGYSYVGVPQFPVTPSFSPDGNYIAQFSSLYGIVLFDAHTLAKLGAIPLSQFISAEASVIFSSDSRRLFVASDNLVYVYDVASRSEIGWFPNVSVFPRFVGAFSNAGPFSSPAIQAADGTGVLFGPLEEGVAFLDSTAMRTGAIGVQFPYTFLNPAFGPAAGGSSVTVQPGPLGNGTVDAVYFGNQLAPSLTPSGNSVSMTAPAGPSGAVDVRVTTNDGGAALVPEGFSYGPTILQVTPDLSTADGGGMGIVYGYGFGPNPASTIPSDLAVRVGGQSANVVGYESNVYGAAKYPFLLQAVAFTIPPGVAGIPADVTVSNSSGSAMARAALSYLPALQKYTLTGATLAQGVYDPHRDVYYFTDASQIQVFSKTKGQWLTPINVPPPTPGATQRLWGISLSPDGSKLAVSDTAANAIYLVDPSQVNPVKSFPIPPPTSGGLRIPAGLAVGDSGIIFYAAANYGGTEITSFFKLDSSSGQITDYKIDGPGGGTRDEYLRTALSADGARVFFNGYGQVFSIDTATGAVFNAPLGQTCCYKNYELTLSSNQTSFTASGYLYDGNLNGESSLTENAREAANVSYVYGMKLSPDGSLLFQPSTSGIDVFDGRLGNLQHRVALPVGLPGVFDALVSDGVDNILLAIVNLDATANGVAVLDLSSVAEPNPLPYFRSGSQASMRLLTASTSLSSARPSAKLRTAAPASPSRMPAHVTEWGQSSPSWLAAPSR